MQVVAIKVGGTVYPHGMDRNMTAKHAFCQAEDTDNCNVPYAWTQLSMYRVRRCSTRGPTVKVTDAQFDKFTRRMLLYTRRNKPSLTLCAPSLSAQLLPAIALSKKSKQLNCPLPEMLLSIQATPRFGTSNACDSSTCPYPYGYTC